MKKLCIIPARGGSKRIPGKNVKDFLGKPIIAYSIETALQSELFEEVMVSTDDEEIAEVAKRYGANVPFFRSNRNSDDFATTMDVINEVVEKYKTLGVKFDYVCCIYPTAPFIEKGDLLQGFELLGKNVKNTFPVVAFSYPIWRGLRRDEQGFANMIWPENMNARSQDLETIYHDAGQWYWFQSEAISEGVFNENSASVVISELKVQDIDNECDWEIAELKYERIQDLK